MTSAEPLLPEAAGQEPPLLWSSVTPQPTLHLSLPRHSPGVCPLQGGRAGELERQAPRRAGGGFHRRVNRPAGARLGPSVTREPTHVGT